MPGALWTWNARRRGVLSSDGWVDAVVVEVAGRRFLIDSFVDNVGVELPRTGGAAAIGRAVRRWLRDRPKRPGLAIPEAEASRPDPEAWDAFCRDVVGVEDLRSNVDRSVFVASRGRVVRCGTSAHGHVEVADEDAAVGALVLDQLGDAPLRPRPSAKAGVTEVDGRWHVMATPRSRWTRPVVAVEAGELAAAVFAALDRSEALDGSPPGPDDRWTDDLPEGRALRHATWVTIGRRADGTLVIDDEQTVAPDDLGAVVRARLVDAVAKAPVEHSSDLGFGSETAWLAFQGVPVAEVVEVLGLVDTLPISRRDGIAWGMEEGVVALGPVDGWTLVAGRDLAVADDLDLAGLSERLSTVVQHFHTHRTVDVHGWAWAERGRIVRTVDFEAGRDPAWLTAGPPTAVEATVGPPRLATEEDVFAVAGAWSVDPTRLPTADADATWGRLP